MGIQKNETANTNVVAINKEDTLERLQDYDEGDITSLKSIEKTLIILIIFEVVGSIILLIYSAGRATWKIICKLCLLS